MGAKCCRIGPKFWPNQKGVGKIRSQRILRFLDPLSPNLKSVFCQKNCLVRKWNCRFWLSATVHTFDLIMVPPSLFKVPYYQLKHSDLSGLAPGGILQFLGLASHLETCKIDPTTLREVTSIISIETFNYRPKQLNESIISVEGKLIDQYYIIFPSIIFIDLS
jgi:hypothetical protein